MNRPNDFWERKRQIEMDAKRVMKELREKGGDWEQEWREHPIAKEYRALLKSAWASKSLLETGKRVRA